MIKNMNSQKKQILENLKNTYCRLKASKIDGVGVFAIRDIPKGENPFFKTPQRRWSKFNISEIKKLDKEILRLIDDFFVIEKNGEVYLPQYGLNGIDISFFVNNSKRPNLSVVENKEKSALDFVTNRKIKKGEELTVSYSTYDYKYKNK